MTKVQADRAATDHAAELDVKVTAAKAALAAVDKKIAVKQADPQNENMAKVLGVSSDTVAMFGQ